LPSIIKVDQIQSDTGTVNQTSNLSFTGTGRRITGDMSNSTLSNRVAFQTSTTDSNSILSVIPNGTATTTAFQAFNNSDPTNASQADLRVSGSSDVRLSSTSAGSGTYLPLTFYTGGVERLRIPADAGGITFPATQAASADPNTLDDYEEGTWTPALSFTANTGITYTVRDGRYTKIGRIVTVGFSIVLSSKGASTGGAFITGLPFPAYNVGGSYPVYPGVLVGEGNMSSMPTGTYALAWSDSRLYLRVNGAANFSNLTDANFTNSSSFYGTVTYEAT
jgi:hypothetical protein